VTRPALLAAALCLATLATPGCLSHERGDDASVREDATLVLDAGTDASEPGSDARAPDGATLCAPEERWVTVRVEAVTSDVARCDVRHVENASLMAVEASPADDGLRLRFDFCPAADADCRCDVVVSNVGTERAADITPLASAIVDLQVGDGPMLAPSITVQRTAVCDCLGCPCSYSLHFHAASGMTFPGASVAPGLSFSSGAAVCEPSGCEFGGTSALHVVADTGEGDVAAGTTLDLGAFHVRSVRDVEVLAPCAACAGCASPYGAWLAWVGP